MNRKRIIPLVVAVAIAFAAYGVARCAVVRCSTTPADRLRDLSFLTRELALDDAQVRAIQRLHADFEAKLGDCCMSHCTARARLGQALVAETNGTELADAMVEEMGRAYVESERAALNQIRHVRALLDATQRSRFDEMISHCLCNAPNTCACSANIRRETDDRKRDQ